MWHPDGRRLYSAGWDTTARVWDVEKCEPIILLNSHAGQVHALALSGDGARLACADSACTIHIWDANRNREVHVTAPQAREIRALAFSPDGRRLASGGLEHIIHLWDAEKASDEDESADPLTTRAAVALSPDGRRLTALAAGAALGVWQTEDAAPEPAPEGAAELQAFVASPDGRWIVGSAAGDDEGAEAVVTLWIAAAGRRVAALEGQAGPATAAGLLRRLRPAGDRRRSQRRRLALEHSRRPAGPPAARRGRPLLRRALTFHPNRRILAVGGIDWLATGGSDGCVALWDLEQRKKFAVCRGGFVGLAFQPDGSAWPSPRWRRQYVSLIWTKTPWRRNGRATPTP